MKKITDFIVNHCYVILVVFLVLSGFCGFLATQVNINHDISKYMPSDSETSLGLELMDNEFGEGETSSYLLMFDDLSDAEKISVQNFIENTDGVVSVLHDQTENYEKDNHTLYDITVEGPADGEVATAVYHAIDDQYKDKYKMTAKGDVYSYNASVLSIWIIFLAVGCAVVILVIMSSSFIEPLLFLIAILLAVVLNYGTNIIFPSVSHITSAIAAVLQMALSMDYSIMLATRYRQEREHTKDKKEAMRQALSKAFGSIASSSITTVVGLFVLVFMSFTIGRDMGLVLSKGVILSLVSIFVCLPALLLLCDKLIAKTKKPTLNLRLNVLGRFAYKIRYFAPVIFLVIMVSSFFLKGNVGILYTDSEMDKIKEVFPENNQVAVIYDNNMEDRVAGYCRDYEERNNVTQIICYSNTINEPELATELSAKFAQLGTKVDIPEELIKMIYYHYYDPNEAHTMTVTDFVKFLQLDILDNPTFATQIDSNMRSQIDRLVNFTDPDKFNQNRSIADLARILEIDSSKLVDLMVLYGSRSDNGVSLTLPEFVQFVQNEVLTNPTYANSIDNNARIKLNQLATFTDKNFINSNKPANALASAFGLNTTQVSSLFQYYLYLNKTSTSTKLSAATLTSFANNNSAISAQLTSEQKQLLAIFAQLDDSGGAYTYAEFPSAVQTVVSQKVSAVQSAVNTLCQNFAEYGVEAQCQQYIYQDDASGLSDELRSVIDEQLTNANLSATDVRSLLAMSAQLEDLDTSALVAKLKQVYILYDVMQELPSFQLTPYEFVSFLLNHKNDTQIQGQISASAVSGLEQAQSVMNAVNSDTRFTSGTLADKLGLNQASVRLLYALYNYKHSNSAPTLSLRKLVNFILSDVVTNPAYSGQISSGQAELLNRAKAIMDDASAGTQLNHTEMYDLLAPLSNTLNPEVIDLLYIYHGANTGYHDEWTMTVEQFVYFLNNKILKDERFADLISDDMRTKITDAKDMITEAKELLVGDRYSRAIINTHYGAEGDDTFSFIQRLKDTFGEDANDKTYVIGSSPMAYEMSQTFTNEMNFITILTMLAIFVVVAITFRSILIPTVLVLLIQTAVWITMSILSITGSSVYFIAMIIVQSILMGATIDYAILYTSYYTELRRTANIKDAIIGAYNKSIHTILTSASVLIIVTAIVGNFASAIAAKICTTISQGTLCSVILILLLLPALLAGMDKFIIHKPFKSKDNLEAGNKDTYTNKTTSEATKKTAEKPIKKTADKPVDKLAHRASSKSPAATDLHKPMKK